VAEGTIVVLIVFPARLMAILRLALLALDAVHIAAAVTGEAATTATAGGGTMLMIGEVEALQCLDIHRQPPGGNGVDLVCVLVILRNVSHDNLLVIRIAAFSSCMQFEEYGALRQRQNC
jgi:hypothetical protein